MVNFDPMLDSMLKQKEVPPVLDNIPIPSPQKSPNHKDHENDVLDVQSSTASQFVADTQPFEINSVGPDKGEFMG
ncbi:hypothetical protein TSUD_218410 [Trifolium subterraneum]|uniref:Uncharacterized protein n=1 Tax=Trifolium subterraneum TaxID=3900 RepID=A0A2Z6MJ65_TRISU|nr:hypothetical protein TSUD_218410 [Trifolium subterraneum]